MKTLEINLCKTMSRMDWIATWVAYKTRTKEGRELVAAYLVKKVCGGWVYKMEGTANLCRPVASDILYDMIRRTELAYFVNQADHLRIDVRSAA